MDLYYRLIILEFHLPPLRERPYDIVPIAVGFLDDDCSKHNVHAEYMNGKTTVRAMGTVPPGRSENGQVAEPEDGQASETNPASSEHRST